MESTRPEVEIIQPRIGLWDAISIIIGIIIGVGIFEAPVEVFQNVSGPWAALAMWALGGLLALVGALCFAELAATYPRSGGEYVYLTRAYGSRIGFLYAWAQLAVIRPASIAAVAYVFGKNAANLWDLGPSSIVVFAALSIFVLSVINILGVTLGKHTQNLLTLAKVLGLVGIGLAGFFWAEAHPVAQVKPPKEGWFATSMIFILWAYSGWHEAAYVATEVKKSRRNLPLALILGTAAVTLIYLLVNAAILVGIGFDAARSSNSVARDLLKTVIGKSAGDVICVVIMISALGAINGMIFTTARISAVFGEDHSLFHPLSRWSRRWGTPVRSLAAQGGLSLVYAVGVGVIWIESDPFGTLVEGSAAAFWLFFLLTGIALFILRRKDASVERPFRVPGFPILPIIFCLWCGYMVVGSIVSEPLKSLIGLVILLAGLPLCFLSSRPRPKTPRERELSLAGTESLPTSGMS